MKFVHISIILSLLQRGNGIFNLTDTSRFHPIHRIIGGTYANIYAFPSMACLILKGPEGDDFRGGAVIISQYWVVTAAHCMNYISYDDVKDKSAFVRSNSANWKENYVEHLIIERHVHEQYDSLITDYDIAVLKVKQPFHGRHEKPVKLANSNFEYVDHSVATVVGWGTTDAKAIEPFVVTHLRFVNIKITPFNTCKDIYSLANEEITNRMICAISPGKDACVYDSGGPLYQDGYLIGLVSWGSSKCAHKVLPGVYTKVSIFHQWITQKTGISSNEKRRKYLEGRDHLKHKNTKKCRLRFKCR